MHEAVSKMTDASIQEANQAYSKQISDQISRVTGELKRMETLLSAGMVDRRVLAEFRHAVNRVRTTGWQVERWLCGDERALSLTLMEDRIRLATRMATQLASEHAIAEGDLASLHALREAITKLDRVLKNL